MSNRHTHTHTHSHAQLASQLHLSCHSPARICLGMTSKTASGNLHSYGASVQNSLGQPSWRTTSQVHISRQYSGLQELSFIMSRRGTPVPKFFFDPSRRRRAPRRHVNPGLINPWLIYVVRCPPLVGIQTIFGGNPPLMGRFFSSWVNIARSRTPRRFPPACPVPEHFHAHLRACF